MASEESGYLRALYKRWAERMALNPKMDLASVRAMLEELHLAAREPEGVSYSEVDADGVPGMWCLPNGCAADRVLLYIHGGGFMFGSMHSHRKLAAHLARAAGVRALVIDYRRAPEHRFPAQLHDVVSAYRWLLSRGVPSDRIATCGDSAGGNLSIAGVLSLRDQGDPLPAAIVSISPWLDLELNGRSLEMRASADAIISRPVLEGMRKAYLDGRRPDDPLASPLVADLIGLPPIHIEVGDQEALVDDALRFVQRAEAAGVEVTVQLTPEMPHVFPCLAGRAPEADLAVARMGGWLRQQLGVDLSASR